MYYYAVDRGTAQEIGSRSTTRLETLGTRIRDQRGNEYIYLKGVASTVRGSLVTWDPDFDTTLATGAQVLKGYPLAVATAASVASEFGWYLLKHTPDADAPSADALGLRVDASASAEVLLYTGATAGQCTSSATVAGQAAVRGAVLGTAQGGSAGLNTSATFNLLRGTT